jgi:predicted component of type VI protein secretion system
LFVREEDLPVFENQLLKIRLSLKGRPIRTYVFNQDSLLIGRNPEANVHLDNPGISRDHVRIQRTPGGYVAEDLNSANGTFVNDAPIRKQHLRHEDVIRIGKFSLWVSLDEDRRGSASKPGALTTGAIGATTVLSAEELQKMMKVAREAEPIPPPEPQSAPDEKAGQRRRGRALVLLGLLLMLVLGAGIGMGTMWFMHR